MTFELCDLGFSYTFLESASIIQQCCVFSFLRTYQPLQYLRFRHPVGDLTFIRYGLLCYDAMEGRAMWVHHMKLLMTSSPWSTPMASPHESQYSANMQSKHGRQYGRPSRMMYLCPPSCRSHSKHAKCFICHARPSASVHSSENMIWKGESRCI